MSEATSNHTRISHIKQQQKRQVLETETKTHQKTIKRVLAQNVPRSLHIKGGLNPPANLMFSINFVIRFRLEINLLPTPTKLLQLSQKGENKLFQALSPSLKHSKSTASFMTLRPYLSVSVHARANTSSRLSRLSLRLSVCMHGRDVRLYQTFSSGGAAEEYNV